MYNYIGVKCPVCEKPFSEGDDIVVCPKCGAPYHRACYEQKGDCVFQDLHEQGKDWEPPQPPASETPAGEASANEAREKVCPVCNTPNNENALFCSRCGTPLQAPTHTGQQAPPPQGAYTPPPHNAYGGTVPPFSFDPMGGVSPAEPLAEGVTFGDASKLVRQNTSYYMLVFRYIKQSGRNKFNLSAFLFSGGWMLFRKQYKFGAIVTALMFALYITYRMLYLFVSMPVLLDLLEGIGLNAASLTNSVITTEQYVQMADLMTQNPASYFALCCPFLCLAAMLAIMIFVGIRGNKMYMNHCVRTVRTIKADNPSGDCGPALIARGGVNIALAACISLSYIVAQYIPLLFV